MNAFLAGRAHFDRLAITFAQRQRVAGAVDVSDRQIAVSADAVAGMGPAEMNQLAFGIIARIVHVRLRQVPRDQDGMIAPLTGDMAVAHQ